MSGSGTIIARQLEISPVFRDSSCFIFPYRAILAERFSASLTIYSTWRLPAFNARIASIIPKGASNSCNLGYPLSSVAINLGLETWITVRIPETFVRHHLYFLDAVTGCIKNGSRARRD